MREPEIVMKTVMFALDEYAMKLWFDNDQPPRIPIFPKLYDKIHMWSGQSGILHRYFKYWPRRVDTHDYQKDVIDELAKQIDYNILESLLGINNLTPNTEVLTSEKLEQEYVRNAKRLSDFHGSRWTDCEHYSPLHQGQRAASLLDEGTH